MVAFTQLLVVGAEHTVPIQESLQRLTRAAGIDGEAVGRHVVEEAARRSVRRVDRAEEPPGFRQELTYSRRTHRCKVGTTMYGSEVRQITEEVELVSHDTQRRCLK